MSTTTLSVVAATMSLLPSWLRSPPATHRIAGERLVCYDLPVWHVFLALEPAFDGEAQLLAGLRPQTLRQVLRRDGNQRPAPVVHFTHQRQQNRTVFERVLFLAGDPLHARVVGQAEIHRQSE